MLSSLEYFKAYGGTSIKGLTPRVEVMGMGVISPSGLNLVTYQDLSKPNQYLATASLATRLSQREELLLGPDPFQRLLSGPLLCKAGILLTSLDTKPQVHCMLELEAGLVKAIEIPLVLQTLARGFDESMIAQEGQDRDILLEITPRAFRGIWQQRKLPENVNFRFDKTSINFNAFRLGSERGIIVKQA